LPEILLRLSRKTDNDVAGKSQAPAGILNAIDSFHVIGSFVTASHQFQYSITSRLNWQVDPITKIVIVFDGRNYIGMEITRKGRGELDSRHIRRGNCPEQTAKRGCAWEATETTLGPGPVAVYILANQMYFLVPEYKESFHLSNNLAGRAAFLPSARIRHDAKRAKFIAAFDYGNKSNMSGMSFNRRNIPDFIFRSLAQVGNVTFTTLCSINQRRNTIRRTRSNYNVNSRSALENSFPFKLCNASHYTNYYRLTVAASCGAYFANSSVDFLFCSFPH
jgi:hypothetical protein